MTRIVWNEGHPEPEWLGALHDGELRPEDASTLRAHAAECAVCSGQLEALVRLSDLTPELERPLAPADSWGGLEDRIMARVAAETGDPVPLPGRHAAAVAATSLERVPSVRRPAPPVWRWMVPMAAVFGVALLSLRLLTSSPSLVGQIHAPDPAGRVPGAERRSAAGNGLPHGAADRQALKEADRAAEEALLAPAAPKAAPPREAPVGVSGSSESHGDKDQLSRSPEATAEMKAESIPQGATTAPAQPAPPPVNAKPPGTLSEHEVSPGAATGASAGGPAPPAPLRDELLTTDSNDTPDRAKALAKERPFAGTVRSMMELRSEAAVVEVGLDSLLADDERRLRKGLSPDSLLAEAGRRAAELHESARRTPADAALVSRALVVARARAEWFGRFRPGERDLENEARIVELEGYIRK